MFKTKHILLGMPDEEDIFTISKLVMSGLAAPHYEASQYDSDDFCSPSESVSCTPVNLYSYTPRTPLPSAQPTALLKEPDYVTSNKIDTKTLS